LQGGAFALVALGFALIFRVTGTINLAQGAFVVVGALLYTFHQVLFWPLWIAFLASLLVTVIVGTLLAKFILEPALRKLPPSGMVILTAGMLTLFEGAILLCWAASPISSNRSPVRALRSVRSALPHAIAVDPARRPHRVRAVVRAAADNARQGAARVF